MIQTPLMPRLTRGSAALVLSISLLFASGTAIFVPAAFAAPSTSAPTLPDTPTHGVSSTNMRGSGAMVLYPARVYSGVPFLVSISSPATGVRTTIQLTGGSDTTVAVQYVAAQGAAKLGWRQIQRELTPTNRGDAVSIGAEPRGTHVEYEWLSWWVTLPRVGQRTLRVEYVSATRTLSSRQDISITAVVAPRHGALAVAYPYAPTYRVWPHAGPSTLPQHLTVVASATAPRTDPMVETYDATVSRPSTLPLPLPAAVAAQAASSGATGTVTDLQYTRTPHAYSPAPVSYTPLDPTVRLLPPGQPAGGGAWGWLTHIL